MEKKLHTFLTSEIDVSSQFHTPATFTSRESLGRHQDHSGHGGENNKNTNFPAGNLN
jgi:hypothetical protein